MTDEEAMEALLNSDGYSFPTWTLKLGLPTDEMRLVMSLIASDKAPIPRDFYSQSARCALALRDHVAACRFIR